MLWGQKGNCMLQEKLGGFYVNANDQVLSLLAKRYVDVNLIVQSQNV